MIGEVEISRGSTRTSASARSIRAATPVRERIPAPTTDTFPSSSDSSTSNALELSPARSTALRVALDHKRLKWHRSVTEPLDLEDNPSPDLEPDRALELRRARDLLDEALGTLADADRAVFVLAELEQLTRAEIASALAIPEGTVASRLGRAREAVETALRRLRARAR